MATSKINVYWNTRSKLLKLSTSKYVDGTLGPGGSVNMYYFNTDSTPQEFYVFL